MVFGRSRGRSTRRRTPSLPFARWDECWWRVCGLGGYEFAPGIKVQNWPDLSVGNLKIEGYLREGIFFLLSMFMCTL